MSDKISLTDRELMIKLMGLIEEHNKKTDEKEKKKAIRKKKTALDTTVPIEDPIKSDITKMLEKPKKRRKPKQDDEEYGEIDDRIENAIPETPRQPEQTPQQQTSFLEQEPIKQTVVDKPVKEKPTPAKLFKDDLLMSIDPSERVKAIEMTKNTLLTQTAPQIKEDEAKRNISNFLTSYSKNKKY